MQAYSTWLPVAGPNTDTEGMWSGKFLQDISKLGFIDKDTGGKIHLPKEDHTYNWWTRRDYDINFKWSKDFYGTNYFRIYFSTFNNYHGFSFNCYPYKNNQSSYGLHSSTEGGPAFPMWFNFIPLVNNSFFINIVDGPSYPDTTQPLPIIVNKETTDLQKNDYITGIIGFFPTGKNYQSDFTYIYWCRGWDRYSSSTPFEINQILFPAGYVNDFKPYCNSPAYPRTINTDLNKYVLTKIPWGNNILDNLFLATVKPTSINPGSTFVYNNKTYLLLFNNFVMEVENAIL